MTESNDKNTLEQKNETPITPKKKVQRKKRATKQKTPELSADLVAEIKDQLRNELIEEFKKENKKKDAIDQQRVDHETALLENLVSGVKESPDPWIIITGRGPVVEEGIKMEIEWNPTFIEFLKTQHITGSDDDDMINNWLTMFLHQIVNLDEEVESGPKSEYE